MESDHDQRTYQISERLTIAALALYCLVIGGLTFCHLFDLYEEFGQAGPSDTTLLLRLVVTAGILGSILRAVESLVAEVGRGSFFVRWSLSILLRPLEGAIIGAVVYFLFAWLAGSLLNPNGYLTVAGIAGMFSHNAAGRIRGLASRLIATPSR